MKISLSSVFVLTSLALVGCSASGGEDAASSESDVTAASSAYTSLEAKDCQNIPMEGQLCGGMLGYQLLVEEGDSRNNVVVKAGGRTMDLDVWSRLPAFSHLGPKAEWRGPAVSPNVVSPYALIFRFFQTDGEGREKSYLVVSRISKDASCIVDTVDGGQANANDRARAIADGARNFQCPGAASEPPPQATSIFTPLGDCPIISSSAEEGWANFSCKGTAGYTIERQSGDARENVVVKRGAAEADLESSAIPLSTRSKRELMSAFMAFNSALVAISSRIAAIAFSTSFSVGSAIYTTVPIATATAQGNDFPDPARVDAKIPKSANESKSRLWPAEDAKLASCAAIPLERRLAYGILTREGMRASELSSLHWRDVSLEHGRVRLDAGPEDAAQEHGRRSPNRRRHARRALRAVGPTPTHPPA